MRKFVASTSQLSPGRSGSRWRAPKIIAAGAAAALAFGGTALVGVASASADSPVTITSLSDGDYLGSDPATIGGFSDESSTVTVTVTNSNGTDQPYCDALTVTEEVSSWSCSTGSSVGLPYGENTFTAAESLDGSPVGETTSVTILRYDSSGTSPSIDSPEPGHIYQSSPGEIAGSGPALGYATVYVDDDESSICEDTPIAADGTWTCEVSLEDGLHSVVAYTKPYDSYVEDSDSSTFLVEPAPAAPAISSPADATTVYTGSVTVSGTVTPSLSRPQTIELRDGSGSEAPVVCSVTIDPGESNWTCDTVLDMGDHALNAVSSFDDYDTEYPDFYDLYFAEGDNTFLNPSAPSHALTVTASDLPSPDVEYVRHPGAQIFSATGVTGSDALIELYSVAVDEDGTPSGWALDATCPASAIDLYYDDGEGGYFGENPYSGNGQTVSCTQDLEAGIWEVYSSQYLEGAPYPGAADAYLRIPDSPTVASRLNDNYTVTIFGTGTPGDQIFVKKAVDDSGVDAGGVICSAQVLDGETWSCTVPASPGSQSYHATDASVGFSLPISCECEPEFLDGFSRWSDSSAVLVVPAPPAGFTPPPASTTPTTIIVPPSWTFDLSGLTLTNVHPGDKFTIHGGGLPAGSIVSFELHSTPVALGTATVGADGTFSLSGVIPSGIEAGEHHIIATLTGPGLAPTSVDKAITVKVESTDTSASAEAGTTNSAKNAESTGTEGGTAHEIIGIGGAPNILTHSMTTLQDVIAHPAKISAAIAIGLVLIIFAMIPAHLLNATISEQYERFSGRFRRIRRPKWFERLTGWLRRAPVVGAIVLTFTTSLLFAFVDPKFGPNLESLRLVLALTLALFVVGFVANWISSIILRQRFRLDVQVHLRPLGLILTIIAVIVSRLLDFSPGFLIGLIMGLSIAEHSAAKRAWVAVVVRTSVIFGLGLAAWLLYSAIMSGGHEGEETSFLTELFSEALIAITTEGIVMVLVELLPIRLLEGERLWQKSKLLWSGIYFVVLVLFVLAVVPWEGNWEVVGSALWAWIAIVVAFGAVCMGIYLYFRFWAPSMHHESAEELEHEQVSIGDDA